MEKKQGYYCSKPKNINILNTEKTQGYYVGSATNMTRLFIFITFLFMLILSSVSFYFGTRLGSLENRISTLEEK